jgi:SAM-dependent methyltransferase
MAALRTVQPEPAAFDEAAAGYDAVFTGTLLGRMLRARVWEVLAAASRPGERVLDLACGTGEDALWLAQQGRQVVASDGSSQMLAVAAQKLQQAGLARQVVLQQKSLQALATAAGPNGEPPFDGVLSNFGGLNTLPAWRPLAAALAQQVRPGGWAVLVVMGPVCPWEVGWNLLHGSPAAAARRWRGVAEAQVGARTIPVWYPAPRRLQRAFAPWFRRRALYSLGLWLPPSELAHLVSRWPRLFHWLDRAERRTARGTAGWGDHYILHLQRG